MRNKNAGFVFIVLSRGAVNSSTLQSGDNQVIGGSHRSTPVISGYLDE
jgi:hypothetical protein